MFFRGALRRVGRGLLAVVTLFALAPAGAQETITYTYDARGRLTNVDHGTTGPNAGVTAAYTYDKADNRTQVVVSTGGGGGSDCSGVTFTIASNGAVTEGTNSVFTVTKSGSTSVSCSVNYATANGTAIAGSDYTAKSGALTFTTAQTSQTVNVVTIDDATVESAETFSMSLSSPTNGAALGTPSTAAATINDNDSGGVCSSVTFTIASNGAVTEGANSVFTVTKHGTATGSCGVNYATANGTAIAGSDYTAKSGALTFTTAQTSQTVNVVTIDDATVESAETFSMSLSSPTNGATLGTPSSATAQINDNDGSTNQPPVANFDNAGSVSCGTFKDVNVVANDTDPDGNYPLSLVSASGSAGINVSVVSSTDIEILGNTSGTKSFSYVVQDSLGATATGSGSIVVTAPCN
jgi:hypothetical protein